ncbi:hypothetical protein KAI87_04300 [Myxococcota bacterium]|nr:hypothetical protein [Myxococcota bacterium]
MDKTKKERLEDAGWKVGDAQDFLQLSKSESDYIEIKAAVAQISKSEVPVEARAISPYEKIK